MGFPYIGAGGAQVDTADQPLVSPWWISRLDQSE